MKKKVSFLMICVLAVAFMGCTERVPPGYVGMVQTPEGLTGKSLPPGNHSCYFRDRLVLIEMVELATTENMNVLCKDDLNFKFDVKLRTRLKAKDDKGIMTVLQAQGSRIEWGASVGKLKFDVLYNTYVKDVARSISRGVVSKYETIQIRDNREEVEKTILNKLTTALQGTPVELVMLATSNFDYPDVITKAVEARRKREIEIGEEKAKQAMELLKADNRLKLAEKMKVVRAIEAEKDAVYMKILGKALTPEYLQLRDIEARVLLYEKIQQGDKVIVAPDTQRIVPMVTPSVKQ